MITTFTAPDGTIIDGDPYILSEVRGLGGPVVRMDKYDKPEMRGEEIVRARYRERPLTLRGYITGISTSTYLTNRQTLLGAFDLSAGLGTYKMVLQNGLALQFEAVPRNPIDAPYLPGEVTMGEFMVELELPDPAFYSQTQHSVDILPGSSEEVNNAGNIRTFPTLRVHGPVNGEAQLINSETGGGTITLTLPSGALVSGEYLDVNIENRTIVKNDASNRFDYFSGTWWPLFAGDNTVSFTAQGSGGSTKLSVIYRDAYLAV